MDKTGNPYPDNQYFLVGNGKDLLRISLLYSKENHVQYATINRLFINHWS